MIKIETDGVFGFKQAIKGMRKPMNSLDRSDSMFQCGFNPLDDGYCDFYYENILGEDVATVDWHEAGDEVQIGPNDHELMMKLGKSGSSHSKYRRFIIVYADITAPLYMLKELDTYRMGVEKNSSSTMHKIHAKEFTLEDFSCEHLCHTSREDLKQKIELLNFYREIFISFDEKSSDPNWFKSFVEDYELHTKKDIWWQMIQLLPSSYMQNREYMFSYEALAKIYQERKDHKLDEWKNLCDWIKTLPYSEIITLEENNEH